MLDKMNVEQAQIEVEEEILNDIQFQIEYLGIQDLIYSVETQGSYAKGTDLPKNGSDIDIFGSNVYFCTPFVLLIVIAVIPVTLKFCGA